MFMPIEEWQYLQSFLDDLVYLVNNPDQDKYSLKMKRLVHHIAQAYTNYKESLRGE